jgi:hypothetical protein
MQLLYHMLALLGLAIDAHHFQQACGSGSLMRGLMGKELHFARFL